MLNNIIKTILVKHQSSKVALELLAKRQMATTTSKLDRFRVYVTKPIPDEAASILKANNVDFVVNEKVPLPREDLLNGVKNVNAIYCTLNEKIDKEVIDAAGPGLKVIGTCSVGFDHIDYKLCKQRNIPVGFTPGVLTGSF